jgi:hypothetical protein
MSQQIEKWGMFEASFDGPSEGNPFRDVAFEAVFSQANRKVSVPGFYDGDGTYRVRFMPDNEGEWSYRTTSKTATLDGRESTFVAGPTSAGNHGPVSVRNRFHFAYADGAPYFPFGTTCYAWTHQPLAMQEETLATLAKTRFNKLRMGVFPKDYPFNQNEPLQDTYARGADGKLDFDRPNPAAFRHFEQQIGKLRDLGIEADVIIFHPYDRWGYCDMSAEQDSLRRLPRGTPRRIPQRVVVTCQRVRLPARHQTDEPVGSLLPYPRGERGGCPAPEVDPQRRPDDELRSSESLGQPCLHPELGCEAHA